MQKIDFTNLVQVKFDLSLVQDSLAATIEDLYSRLGKLESTDDKFNKLASKLEADHHKLYEYIEQSNERNGLAYKELEDRFNSLGTSVGPSNASRWKTKIPIPQLVEKTPKEVLDHIEKRHNQGQYAHEPKEVDVVVSPANSDRACETIRVKETIENVLRTEKDELDNKVYEIYAKALEKIQGEVIQLRKDFRYQMNDFTSKSVKILDDKIVNIKISTSGDKEDPKSIRDSATTPKHANEHAASMKAASYHHSPTEISSTLNVEGGSGQVSQQKPGTGGKSQKVVVISNKVIEGTTFSKQPKSLKNIDDAPTPQVQMTREQKQDFTEFISELKREIKYEMEQIVKAAEEKYDEINRTNSVLADHLVEAKKSIEELANEKDAIALDVSAIKEKSTSSQKQLVVLVDNVNQHKNKLRSVQSTITRLIEEIKSLRTGEAIQEENNQDGYSNSLNSSRKDIFRDSHSSFRSSIANNLNPIRHNSVLKANNNKMDTMEETIKQMSLKMASAIDRLNRMEDERKRELFQLSGSLPKIDKENKSNVNPLEIIKRELKKVNDDIIKTNEKLSTTKDRLNQLYETHADLPNKIQDIYIKLREKSELQEDRLIELIKELINRILSDPFDNNFTNRLKREINVKFLEIKHEYNCILKEIEGKVEGRAEISALAKMEQKYQEGLLEVKSLAAKKCETEDFKKGVKYLEGKIKEVFQFAQKETVALANEQKQYIGAKRQSLH